jgi:hypothetical protein
MRRLQVAAIGVALLTGSGLVMGDGQVRQSPSQGMPPSPVQTGPGIPPIGGVNMPEMDPMGRRVEEQQIKSRNNERQKRMVADTDKLLVLTKELKDRVERQDKSISPGDVEKKAEEIEKLAKSVKDRMKG